MCRATLENNLSNGKWVLPLASILGSCIFFAPYLFVALIGLSFGIGRVKTMPERTLIKAQFYGKCPRCREGDIFKYPIRKVLKFSAMHDDCPHVELLFSPEPGFYWCHVSYAL